MKEGYKMSKLGEIPVDWNIYDSVDICDITSSKRIKKSEYLARGIPFFRGKEITYLSKKKELKDLVYISNEKYKELKGKFGAPVGGDILITAVGTIGSIYLVKDDDKFYFKDGNLIWLRNISNKIYKDFLAHYYCSNIFQEIIDIAASGSSQKALTIVKFKNLPVLIPSFSEQQKIAKILSTVNEKIAVIDKQLKATQTLKKGLMQRLLTKGIGHTEFKESVFGEIPMGWEILKFEEVLTDKKNALGYGILQPGIGIENGIKMLRTVDLTETGRANTVILEVPEEISNTSKTTLLEGGEILLSVMGTLGRTTVVPKEWKGWNVNRALAVIRTRGVIDNYFLCHFFRSPYFKRLIEQQSLGSAQMRINLTGLRKYLVPVPPINEQQKIAKIINTVDDKINVLSNKKIKYQTLKKGLMQKLLTGKIRVKTSA